LLATDYLYENNIMKTKKRLDRITQFEEFYKNAESNFNDIRESDTRCKEFADYYSFYIAPGSRAGHTDKRQVDIFFGKSVYGSSITATGSHALVEEGATLLYSMNDDGFVSVMLYPAKAENMSLKEELIFLERRIDPENLLLKKTLQNHWRYFMAYMEYSSLDGSPSVMQRLRITYLHTFKSMVINKIWNKALYKTYMNTLFKFVMTIGLSGFVFVGINAFLEKNKVNKTEKAVIEISKEVKQIRTRLQSK